ncbi:hypothetical protein RPMA_03870 [Tardiphaga alba]|uniref:Uncharacterized protein n=1 Tax=Tardiphaga alba TaxID=340268 RepID=A0ABX8A406_9BRAD|nr:hypothetical protein [Tardiphaga alba]QUS38087.1 hypothetical protein RPMA_03870 [Tardiphaga alba]
MRGSVTIWHDTSSIDADGYAPRVEVHVNIWRNNHRSADGHFDLFDIGFRFKEVRALKSLSMSLPFVVDATQIEDLFDRMHDQSTISAIFNETLTPGSIEDENRCFAVTHTENKKTQFYVWRCTDESRRLSTAGGKDDRGTIITIDDRFFKRLQSRVGDHYLRLRIKMPIGLPNGFVSTSDPKDSVFLSTISTNEIVEFRLNERRNFSTEIRDRLEGKNCGLIDISAVHYFLIRDMSVEMTQSHAGFRKMRRLEPGMWTNYLPGADFNPDEMIIYHWASFADKPSGKVDSFNALATFRAFYTGKLWIYALVIIMLGAMGSALQASIVAWLSKLPCQIGSPDRLGATRSS